MFPEPKRDRNRINVKLMPPSCLITRPMKLSVMDPANWHGELVAYPPSKGTRLRKREVMRIRWYAATHKTRLPQHELSVIFIAQADRFTQSKGHPSARLLLGNRRRFLVRAGNRLEGGYEVFVAHTLRQLVKDQDIWRTGSGGAVRDMIIADGQEPSLKPLFDNFGIPHCKRVLGGEILTSPRCRLIT
jgi:hypothetical protein